MIKKRALTCHIFKLLGWSFITALLLMLLIHPLDGAFLALDDGLAFAQTGAKPPDSDDTDSDDKVNCPDGSQVNDPAHCPEVKEPDPLQPVQIPGLPVCPVTVDSDTKTATTEQAADECSTTTINTHNDGRATLHMPAQGEARKIIFTSMDSNTIGVTNPGQAIVLNIVVESNTGAVVTSHSPSCLILGIKVPNPPPFSLFRQDSEGNIIEIAGTFNYDTGVYIAELCNTSTFFLLPQAAGNSDTFLLPPAADNSFTTSDAVIPAGLPKTGGGNISQLPWIIGFALVIAVATIGVWRWRFASNKE